MNNASYTILSRQVGLTRELTGIANNIANADTTGFRTESYLFSEYVRKLGPEDQGLAQTSTAGRFFNNRQGGLVPTGAALDIAIEGDGFFLVETPRGESLTRAGNFVRNEQGQLSTVEGYAVFGEGGSPIAIPANSESISIAPDGSIAIDGAVIGRLTVYTAPPTTLAREGNRLLATDADITPVAGAQVHQGFVEDSNVNAVLELSRLIEVQRAYEINQQLLADEDERISRTIENAGQR